MSRAYEVHIHRQLHPDEVLITGNAKRHKPRKVWAEIADADAEWRRKNLEDWKERMAEWNKQRNQTEQDEPHTD